MALIPGTFPQKFRLELLSLLGFCTVACSSGEVNLELTSMAAEDSALYDHAAEYLTGRAYFSQAFATLQCPSTESPSTESPSTESPANDSSDGDSSACLLRVEGRDEVYEGASRTLILHVATGAQPLPGAVDLAALGTDTYGVEPIVYANTEDVDPDETVKRYGYSCVYHSGSVYLFEAPVVGEKVSGQFEALELSCTTQLAPDETVPALLTGTFEVEITARTF